MPPPPLDVLTGRLALPSWHEYATEEFGFGSSRAYQFLDSARVLSALEAHSTNVESEAVARELVPALKTGDIEEVWGEVVAEHGPKPTAAQTREVVQRSHAFASRDIADLLGLAADVLDARPTPHPNQDRTTPLGPLSFRSIPSLT